MNDYPIDCKVEIRRTCIIIHNYEPGEFESLERTFSVYDKIRHRSFVKVIWYDEQNKDLYIPSGIDISFIMNRYRGEKIVKKLVPDKYELIMKSRMKYPPRDIRQSKAIDFCLGLGKYKINQNKSQISLNLNTGVGKTYVAIYVSNILAKKTMMITSSLNWIEQWKNKILEYCLDVKEDEIYIISGTASIAKLLLGVKDMDKIKYYLVSIDTFKSYAEKYSWNKLRELFNKLEIGTKIFDEAHLYFEANCMMDYFSDVDKTFYLTATPMRADRKENFIYQLTYKNVPRISLFDQEKDPRTRYEAYMYSSHPSPKEINSMRNAYGFNRIKYTSYLAKKPVYNILLDYVVNLIYTKTSPKGKALIYIGTNDVIKETCKYLISKYDNISLGVYTSIVPKDKKEEQLNRKIIISTTKSFGAAMDVKNLEMVILLNEPFKFVGTTIQTLGRTRDDNTVYIEFVDTGFNDLIRYYRLKQKVFSKYATSCNSFNFANVDKSVNIQKLNSNMRDNSFRNDKKQVMTFKNIDKKDEEDN